MTFWHTLWGISAFSRKDLCITPSSSSFRPLIMLRFHGFESEIPMCIFRSLPLGSGPTWDPTWIQILILRRVKGRDRSIKGQKGFHSTSSIVWGQYSRNYLTIVLRNVFQYFLDVWVRATIHKVHNNKKRLNPHLSLYKTIYCVVQERGAN